MKAPLDELLVRLGLEVDAKSFKEGTNQLSQMRSTALKTGGAITGVFFGATKIANDVARSSDELRKLSRDMGVSAQYAYRLGYAMKQVGGNTSDAFSLIERANSLRDHAKWGELADKAFTAVGFNPQRIQQESMTTEQTISFLAEGLSKMGVDQRRQISEALGINGLAFRLMSDVSGMHKNIRDADKFGAVPTDEFLDNAEAYSTAAAEFKEAVNGFKTTIAAEMLPGMTKFLEGVTGWSLENKDDIDKVIEENLPHLKTLSTGVAALVAAKLGTKGLALLAANGPLAAAVGLATFYMDEGNRESMTGAYKSSWGNLNRQVDELLENIGVKEKKKIQPQIQQIHGDIPVIDDSWGPEFTGVNLGSKAYQDYYEERARSLMPALIQQESGGRHTDENGNLITSPAGARGIAQIMPATGRQPGFGVRPLQNDSEEEHIRFATDYLAALLKHFKGDDRKALAAYNAGVGAIERAVKAGGDDWLNFTNDETRNYVPGVLTKEQSGPLASTTIGSNQHGAQSEVPEYLSRIQAGPPDMSSYMANNSGPTIHNSYHIDARGASDPAAFKAAMVEVFNNELQNTIRVGFDDISVNVV